MEKWKKIKCLAVDVDGVLTDGTISLGASGQWIRHFFIRDGLGLLEVKKRGYKTAFITTSRAEDIRERAKNLKIDFFFEGADNKDAAFSELLSQTGFKAEEVAYIGDDTIDLPIFERCGIAISPCDAHESVLARAHVVTTSYGGRGAVREICDHLLDKGSL